LLANTLFAQVSIYNFAENQFGNSRIGNEDEYGLYNQFNAKYSQGDLLFGVRVESYGSTDSLEGYRSVTQRYVEYRQDDLRIRAGNFYNIFGNGIVSRAFELPGVILDDFRTKTRYSPSRDIDGVLIEYLRPSYKLNLMMGVPVESSSSPAVEERRSGKIQGLNAEYRMNNFFGFGASYLHIEPESGSVDEIYSFRMNLNSNALRNLYRVEDLYLDIRGELSNRNRNLLNRGLTLSTENPHALYLATNLDYKKFSLSAEYKDYMNYNTGVNDPPSLIKEHSYLLLNRDTHVLIPKDEEGYQIEGHYYLSTSTSFTANVSFARNARNDLFVHSTDFSERFFEIEHKLNDDLHGAIYIADSKNEFEAISDKNTIGTVLNYDLGSRTGIRINVSYQSATRDIEYYLEEGDNSRLFSPVEFTNLLIGGSIGRSRTFNFGLITERTTDQLLTDTPSTGDGIKTVPRWWSSFYLSFEPGRNHEVRIFGGQRRGGPACTAGTCYEVLPFEGIELILISRF